MGQRKSARVTERATRKILDDDDRISRLDDGVIHHIYSFMDTRFAVQSSVLSNRFRDTWKFQPYLNFKLERFNNQINAAKFPNFVHRFLCDRDNKAQVTTIDFRSNSIKLPLLKEIIIYAMSHRTQKLNIEFLGDKTRRRGFDLSLFRSRFLQDLRLSIDVALSKSPSLTWDLPGLTSLNLESVTFTLDPSIDGNSIELFSHFSNLKTLVLIGCRLSQIETLIITSKSLKSLSLIDLNHNHSEFIISAPNLSSFTYYGPPHTLLSAKDLDSLQTLNFHTVYNRAIQMQQEVVENMIKIFKQLRKAKFLTVNSDVLRFLSGFPKLLEARCPFMSLTSLTLVEHRLPPSSIVFSDVMAYFRSGSPGVTVNIEIGVAPLNARSADCL